MLDASACLSRPRSRRYIHAECGALGTNDSLKECKQVC